jgi:hypothetical protein
MNRGVPFVRADFDMEKYGYVDRRPLSGMTGRTDDSEWSQYVRAQE